MLTQEWHVMMVLKQQGSTLIEVMVAVLIVTIGLLGMASLQLTSMSLNLSAYQRLQATNLAYEIADSIALNSDEASQGKYNLALVDNAPQNADPNTMAEIDLIHWIATADNLLPDGDIIITAPVNVTGIPILGSSDPAQQYDITICWTDKKVALLVANDCGATNKEMFVFRVSSKG